MNVDMKELTEIATGVYKKNEKTFFVKCHVSGQLCYCSKERLDKLIKKCGGLNKVHGCYVSRDAKRLLKDKTPAKSIAKMSVEDLKATAKMVKEDKDKKRSERKEKRAMKRAIRRRIEIKPVSTEDRRFYDLFDGDQACLRPNLFRRNGGYCNNCNWLDCCKYADKKMKDFEDDPVRKDAIKGLKKFVDVAPAHVDMQYKDLYLPKSTDEDTEEIEDDVRDEGMADEVEVAEPVEVEELEVVEEPVKKATKKVSRKK